MESPAQIWGQSFQRSPVFTSLMATKQYTTIVRSAGTDMAKPALDQFYDFLTGDEDARVCKDIPESACRHQPRNFFAYLVANLLNKIADEIASAKLVLPWMLGVLGAPVALVGLLVPIREAGALLPQLVVAAAVRHLPRRKGVWLLGALLSAGTLALIAVVAVSLQGVTAGWTILGLLALFSLARGLCSVSAKDVLGKTVSKSRRGLLMGWSASLGGAAVLIFGLALSVLPQEQSDTRIFAWLFGGAALLWLLAAVFFAAIEEEPGATEGGGNALTVALKSFDLLRTDPRFRHFVMTRLLLLAVALAPPFYVLLAQQGSDGGFGDLGWLVAASGLGSVVSSPFWGRLGDRSSRQVMAIAAAGHGVLGLAVGCLTLLNIPVLTSAWTWVAIITAVTVLHAGVRLGRKVYLVDMATGETRAAFVALSNTVIGIAMLGAGLIGVLGDLLGAELLVLGLGLVSLVAADRARRLPEVSA